MNNLLGAHFDWYGPVNMIALYLMIIYNLTRLKVKKEHLSNISLKIIGKISKNNSTNCIRKFFSNKMFWGVIETLLITYIQWAPIGILNVTMGKIANTGANYFGTLLFIPYILVLVCWLFRLDPLAQIDLIAPAYALALVPVKIACFFAGCCTGFVTEHGMYNAQTGLVEFPAQLLECVAALGIFIFLITWKKKLTPGTRLPIYIIIYSAIRFVTEFTRGQEIVFGGLKTYQILCIIAIAIGFVQMFLVQKYGYVLTKIGTGKKVNKEEKIKEVVETTNE